MPFISLKLSVPLPLEKEVSIKSKLGKAISIFPGKSENWLMCEFKDNCHLWFNGTNDVSSAFVDVYIYGGEFLKNVYDNFTSEICIILEKELSIPSNRIYIKYESISHWGYNGSNF